MPVIEPAAAPRKLPRQARSRALVEAIIEATARIFERAGPAACTTNAVAEKAGVSIGSLYQYFPNRRALTAGWWRASAGSLSQRSARRPRALRRRNGSRR
ncbi:helix-turn-helix domain-containing protein [Cronobacter dublinensis]|uniref:helix-turn-helix domain-containing protein n=1 Tax=Cronobacter dublinensis TaxID=413497 RepID=UPI001F3B953D|nr:helix-turn-helix domain-containing protein [Cronobacter dublinensis]